jgi:hypothetical protein
MLQTFAIILIVLWLVGMVANMVIGGLLHLLLVVAIGLIVLRLLQRRRAVK